MTEDTSAYGEEPGKDAWSRYGIAWGELVDGQGLLEIRGTPKEIEQAVERLHYAYMANHLEWLKTMPYHDYLKTDHWASTRDRKLKEVGDRCQICNSDGPVDVHHRTYDGRGNELMLDLTVLCRDCHTLFHQQGRLAS